MRISDWSSDVCSSDLPIRRIADTDRVAATAALMDAELLQHFEKCHGNVACGVARLGRVQAGGDALDHGFFAIEKMLRRLAQVDGERKRAVVTRVATGGPSGVAAGRGGGGEDAWIGGG